MATTTLQGRHVQDIANLVLAVCLFISPWVLGFAGEERAAMNAWIFSVVLAGLAIAALAAFAEWEEWVTGIVGVWLIIAPWAAGFASNMAAMWTHLVLGILVVAASGWAVWEYRHTPHATA